VHHSKSAKEQIHEKNEQAMFLQCDGACIEKYRFADEYENMLHDARCHTMKKHVEVAIFATPIRLNMQNFVTKKVFNMCLNFILA
jgi:hypothetical protein